MGGKKKRRSAGKVNAPHHDVSKPEPAHPQTMDPVPLLDTSVPGQSESSGVADIDDSLVPPAVERAELLSVREPIAENEPESSDPIGCIGEEAVTSVEVGALQDDSQSCAGEIAVLDSGVATSTSNADKNSRSTVDHQTEPAVAAQPLLNTESFVDIEISQDMTNNGLDVSMSLNSSIGEPHGIEDSILHEIDSIFDSLDTERSSLKVGLSSAEAKLDEAGARFKARPTLPSRTPPRVGAPWTPRNRLDIITPRDAVTHTPNLSPIVSASENQKKDISPTIPLSSAPTQEVSPSMFVILSETISGFARFVRRLLALTLIVDVCVYSVRRKLNEPAGCSPHTCLSNVLLTVSPAVGSVQSSLGSGSPSTAVPHVDKFFYAILHVSHYAFSRFGVVYSLLPHQWVSEPVAQDLSDVVEYFDLCRCNSGVVASRNSEEESSAVACDDNPFTKFTSNSYSYGFICPRGMVVSIAAEHQSAESAASGLDGVVNFGSTSLQGRYETAVHVENKIASCPAGHCPGNLTTISFLCLADIDSIVSISDLDTDGDSTATPVCPASTDGFFVSHRADYHRELDFFEGIMLNDTLFANITCDHKAIRHVVDTPVYKRINNVVVQQVNASITCIGSPVVHITVQGNTSPQTTSVSQVENNEGGLGDILEDTEHGSKGEDVLVVPVLAEHVAGGQVKVGRRAVEQVEAERIATEQVTAEQAEAERIAAEQAEAERKAVEQAEAERIAAEQVEAERVAAEQAEAEQIAAEQAEAERIAAEQAEAERVAAEQAEAEQIAAEQAEAERIAAEQVEAERAAVEQAEAERIAAEQAEAERVAAEQAEAERVAAQQAEAERAAAEQAEAERIAAEQVEAERVAVEQAEAGRVAAELAERIVVEREEAEISVVEQAEAEQLVAALVESEIVAVVHAKSGPKITEKLDEEGSTQTGVDVGRIAAEVANFSGELAYELEKGLRASAVHDKYLDSDIVVASLAEEVDDSLGGLSENEPGLVVPEEQSGQIGSAIGTPESDVALADEPSSSRSFFNKVFGTIAFILMCAFGYMSYSIYEVTKRNPLTSSNRNSTPYQLFERDKGKAIYQTESATNEKKLRTDELPARSDRNVVKTSPVTNLVEAPAVERGNERVPSPEIQPLTVPKNVAPADTLGVTSAPKTIESISKPAFRSNLLSKLVRESPEVQSPSMEVFLSKGPVISTPSVVVKESTGRENRDTIDPVPITKKLVAKPISRPHSPDSDVNPHQSVLDWLSSPSAVTVKKDSIDTTSAGVRSAPVAAVKGGIMSEKSILPNNDVRKVETPSRRLFGWASRSVDEGAKIYNAEKVEKPETMPNKSPVSSPPLSTGRAQDSTISTLSLPTSLVTRSEIDHTPSQRVEEFPSTPDAPKEKKSVSPATSAMLKWLSGSSDVDCGPDDGSTHPGEDIKTQSDCDASSRISDPVVATKDKVQLSWDDIDVDDTSPVYIPVVKTPERISHARSTASGYDAPRRGSSSEVPRPTVRNTTAVKNIPVGKEGGFSVNSTWDSLAALTIRPVRGLPDSSATKKDVSERMSRSGPEIGKSGKYNVFWEDGAPADAADPVRESLKKAAELECITKAENDAKSHLAKEALMDALPPSERWQAREMVLVRAAIDDAKMTPHKISIENTAEVSLVSDIETNDSIANNRKSLSAVVQELSNPRRTAISSIGEPRANPLSGAFNSSFARKIESRTEAVEKTGAPFLNIDNRSDVDNAPMFSDRSSVAHSDSAKNTEDVKRVKNRVEDELTAEEEEAMARAIKAAQAHAQKELQLEKLPLHKREKARAEMEADLQNKETSGSGANRRAKDVMNKFSSLFGKR